MSLYLKYPGYMGRQETFKNSGPFQTEYTGNFSGESKPVLYTQVPKYSWQEPQRPNMPSSRYDKLYQPTHLTTPFASSATKYSQRNSTRESRPTMRKTNYEETKYLDLKFLSASTRNGSRTTEVGGKKDEISDHVAARPQSGLLTKYPHSVRYVRHNCHFQPIVEAKKHYCVVHPRWFSERNTFIRKNNVFS